MDRRNSKLGWGAAPIFSPVVSFLLQKQCQLTFTSGFIQAVQNVCRQGRALGSLSSSKHSGHVSKSEPPLDSMSVQM